MARPMLRIGVVLMNAGSSVFWSEQAAMTSVPPFLMPAGATVADVAVGWATGFGAAAAVGAVGTVGGAGAVAGPQLAAATPPAACTVSTRNARRVTFTDRASI